VLWDIAGAGPSSKYVRFAYTKADDEAKRTVRPENLSITCAGWGVESVEVLTVAQAALTLNVVRSESDCVPSAFATVLDTEGSGRFLRRDVP
jgi:hypothetical protein